MCCTRLAGNTRRKNDAKNCHLRTIAQLCRTISSQLRHVSTIGKKLVKQQYLPHMSLQYGELRPTSGWDRAAPQQISTGFASWQRYCTAKLRRWTEGATCIRQGGHHVGHWPTFLVANVSKLCFNIRDWAYAHTRSMLSVVDRQDRRHRPAINFRTPKNLHKTIVTNVYE